MFFGEENSVPPTSNSDNPRPQRSKKNRPPQVIRPYDRQHFARAIGCSNTCPALASRHGYGHRVTAGILQQWCCARSPSRHGRQSYLYYWLLTVYCLLLQFSPPVDHGFRQYPTVYNISPLFFAFSPQCYYRVAIVVPTSSHALTHTDPPILSKSQSQLVGEYSV